MTGQDVQKYKGICQNSGNVLQRIRSYLLHALSSFLPNSPIPVNHVVYTKVIVHYVCESKNHRRAILLPRSKKSQEKASKKEIRILAWCPAKNTQRQTLRMNRWAEAGLQPQ